MARFVRTGLVFAVVAAIVYFCGGTLFPQRRAGSTRIVVYGFSIVSEALREDIFPLFRDQWRSEHGGDIEFIDSYAGSGTIANQIVNGAPADVAILSHPGDAERVARARSTRDWRAGEHGGIVNRTPIAIAVRKGNPKGIQTFGDLGRAGIRVVHPDPLTSGGAQWAVLAEYAEPILRDRATGRPPSTETAAAQLAAIWRNVVAQAPSARAARTQFDQDFGDALVTYEVELLLDRARGTSPVDTVVPAFTILCEHPVVILDRNIDPAKLPVVEAFVKFLASPKAQRAFVRHGFRSIDPALDAANPGLARLDHPCTIADLGGWDEAQREIIEDAWKGHALAEARK
ncbi:MAG TPA: substrate-binding domain-containing protein [Planctomycetota bacterium]|nr:substrate-binding domain-containing protein [Planctomycetota bacterium]